MFCFSLGLGLRDEVDFMVLLVSEGAYDFAD